MVRVDEASRQIWLDAESGALRGMRRGCIAIESSMLSHSWVVELGQALQAVGMQFLEAPVSGSRKQAATAERVVADKQMDLVMIGLAHLANPNWAY